MNRNLNVLIIGASKKPDRYAYKAMNLLLEHGYNTILYNPAYEDIEDHKVYKNLSDIKEKIHSITMYINPSRSDKLTDDILALKPDRIIFNPGTENSDLQVKAEAAGIRCLEACTLVLLKTGQFESV